jgi:elongation factor G
VTEDLIHEAVRAGVLSRELTPVFVGSAYKNKGVQLLMDAVVRYLPDPTEVENHAIDLSNGDEREFPVSNKPDDDFLALAFKLEDGPYGQLTYLRVYQGIVKKGDSITNSRSGRKIRVGRLVRMHADEMEDIDSATVGDIVALFGVDCASGDTLTTRERVTMTSMHVPEPVISLAVKPADRDAQQRMARALQRFAKEDPTFRIRSDEETGETLIQGMGELHLEVYLERIRREFNAVVETGKPKVAYRETVGRRVDFDHTHKKQTGGAGQFAKVQGYMEPTPDPDFQFESLVTGGNIPTQFIPSCEKGFRSSLEEGPYAGFPVEGIRVVLEDGAWHRVDSSDTAFQTACRAAFRESYVKANPIVMEPLMLVSLEGPTEYQGDCMGSLMQRRGIIVGTTEDNGFIRIDAHVPLAEMFGYATVLRSLTQGKAGFTMEFARYAPAPSDMTEELVAEYTKKRSEGR